MDYKIGYKRVNSRGKTFCYGLINAATGEFVEEVSVLELKTKLMDGVVVLDVFLNKAGALSGKGLVCNNVTSETEGNVTESARIENCEERAENIDTNTKHTDISMLDKLAVIEGAALNKLVWEAKLNKSPTHKGIQEFASNILSETAKVSVVMGCTNSGRRRYIYNVISELLNNNVSLDSIAIVKIIAYGVDYKEIEDYLLQLCERKQYVFIFNAPYISEFIINMQTNMHKYLMKDCQCVFTGDDTVALGIFASTTTGYYIQKADLTTIDWNYYANCKDGYAKMMHCFGAEELNCPIIAMSSGKFESFIKTDIAQTIYKSLHNNTEYFKYHGLVDSMLSELSVDNIYYIVCKVLVTEFNKGLYKYHIQKADTKAQKKEFLREAGYYLLGAVSNTMQTYVCTKKIYKTVKWLMTKQGFLHRHTYNDKAFYTIALPAVNSYFRDLLNREIVLTDALNTNTYFSLLLLLLFSEKNGNVSFGVVEKKGTIVFYVTDESTVWYNIVLRGQLDDCKKPLKREWKKYKGITRKDIIWTNTEASAILSDLFLS